MGVQLELRSMVDQALGCPDKGIVNFNVLHNLLHEILNRLEDAKAARDTTKGDGSPIGESDELMNHNVENQEASNSNDNTERSSGVDDIGHARILYTEQSRSSPRLDDIQKRLDVLESRYEALNTLQTDQLPVGEDFQPGTESRENSSSSKNALAVMWKFMTIHRRVQATEEAVEKVMDMLNNVLQDVNRLKNLESELEKVRENHLQLMKEFDSVKSGAFESNMEKISEFMKQYDSLESVAFKRDATQFVTWTALEQALNRTKDEAKMTGVAVDQTDAAEACFERPGTAPVSSSTVWEKADHEPPKTAMSPKDYVKVTGQTPNFEAETEDVGKPLHESEGVQNYLSSKENSFGEISLDASLEKENITLSRESTQNSGKPSPELINQLGRLGELPKQYDDVAVQVSTLSELQLKLASDMQKVEVDILPQKVDRQDLQLPDNLMEQIEMLKEGLDFINTNQDLQMLATIKTTSIENKENIDRMRRELGLFSQHLKRLDQPRSRSPESSAPSYDQDVLNSVRNDLTLIQEEQQKNAVKSKEDVAKILETLDEKQRFIDDLFQYTERLQERKADRENVETEMNVKADKNALDSKVNQSTFDQTFELFDRGLQEALQKMEDYMNEEMALKDTLSRISQEMEGKIDNDSLQLMKDYFEKQIKDVQESRDRIARETRVNANDAAGMCRKLPINYRCISCNRPVEVSVRDTEPALPGMESLPVRRLKFPLTSYDVEQLRQRSTKAIYNIDDSAALRDYISNRPCGGSHTIINSQLRKSTKLHQFHQTTAARDDPRLVHKMAREVSVLDFLRGTDGHYYKGRRRHLLPSLPKRTNPVSSDHHVMDKSSYKVKQVSSGENTATGSAEPNKGGFSHGQRTPSPPVQDKCVDNLSSSYPEKSFNDTRLAKMSLEQQYSSDDMNVPSTTARNNRESIKVLQTRRKRAHDKETRLQRCWDNNFSDGKVDAQNKPNEFYAESQSPKSIKRTTPVGQEEPCSGYRVEKTKERTG